MQLYKHVHLVKDRNTSQNHSMFNMSQSSSVEKVYVIFKGRRPGICFSWIECEDQISGFKGAAHQKYPSYEDAVRAWLTYNKPTQNNYNEKEHVFYGNTSTFSGGECSCDGLNECYLLLFQLYIPA